MKKILLFVCILSSVFTAPSHAAKNSDVKGLSRQQAEEFAQKQWQIVLEKLRAERADEMKNQAITIGDKTMRLLARTFGKPPEGGRPLVISLHGGGHAPAAVNDQQWQNQIRLYQPEGSLYVAPRAPTNTWNLWHEEHMDAFYDRLIENCVVLYGINPNRVYVMGYSAGGDGVYQIGPRMADRWAAASMMAGHPNEALPLSLRNTPFSLQVGGKDTAHKRNEVCQEWASKLEALEKANPGSYVHFFKYYPEHGHWMNRDDAVAVPWMLKYTRNPWPKAITWYQDDVIGTRFYWLSVDKNLAKKEQLIEATCEGQMITIKAEDPKKLTLRLSDHLLDLDQEIKVVWNEKVVFQGKVARSESAIVSSLSERADPSSVATALLKVEVAP